MCPGDAVASVPVGRVNVLRTVAVPFTSSVVAGAVVPIPILFAESVMFELPIVAEPVQRARGPVVPVPARFGVIPKELGVVLPCTVAGSMLETSDDRISRVT